MRRTLNFTKKNFIELSKDILFPLIFCVFPIIFISLMVFAKKSRGEDFTYYYNDLIPSTMTLVCCLVMLYITVIVGKDKKTGLLKRMSVSPMRTPEYLFAYVINGVVVGLVSLIITYLSGLVLSACCKDSYIDFGKCMLTTLSQIPLLITMIYLGILLGSACTFSGALTISAALLVVVSIVSSAFFPVYQTKTLQTVFRCLPFYPSVYIGRVITEARMVINYQQVVYTFDDIAKTSLVTVFVYMAAFIAIDNATFGLFCKRQNN